jgi:hemerythrin
MLHCSEQIEIHHKKLTSILFELVAAINNNKLEQAVIDDILERLLKESSIHFMYEEQLMKDSGISQKHIKFHKMEHSSFMYDLKIWCNYFGQANSTMEMAEKLVYFITTWLTNHAMEKDRALKVHVKFKYFQKNYLPDKKNRSDKTVNHLFINALLGIWEKLKPSLIFGVFLA